jgi:hypothetical protein
MDNVEKHLNKLACVLSDDMIETLARELAQVMSKGWGEVRLIVKRGQVVGHVTMTSKNFGVFKDNNPSPGK